MVGNEQPRAEMHWLDSEVKQGHADIPTHARTHTKSSRHGKSQADGLFSSLSLLLSLFLFAGIFLLFLGVRCKHMPLCTQRFSCKSEDCFRIRDGHTAAKYRRIFQRNANWTQVVIVHGVMRLDRLPDHVWINQISKRKKVVYPIGFGDYFPVDAQSAAGSKFSVPLCITFNCRVGPLFATRHDGDWLKKREAISISFMHFESVSPFIIQGGVLLSFLPSCLLCKKVLPALTFYPHQSIGVN